MPQHYSSEEILLCDILSMIFLITPIPLSLRHPMALSFNNVIGSPATEDLRARLSCVVLFTIDCFTVYNVFLGAA